MAKIRFLTDPNTFWMILGTSKILRFFGPVVDPRTPYLSWIYFKKYKKKYGNILGKYGFWISENLKISKFSKVLCTWLLEFWYFEIRRFEISKFEDLKFWRSEILIFRNDDFLKMMKSRRRGISWHSFCQRNFSKSLDMNLV